MLSSSVWVKQFTFGEEHWFLRRFFSTPSLTQALDQSIPGISNNNKADYTLSELNVLSTDAKRFWLMYLRMGLSQGATRSNGTKALVFITQTPLQLSI